MLIGFVMSAAYQGMFSKQTWCKAILPDANDLPVHQLEEWKRQVEKKKEPPEGCKEKALTRCENTKHQNDCPRLRRERKNIGSKLGPYWALS
jgi:hypothetical protein